VDTFRQAGTPFRGATTIYEARDVADAVLGRRNVFFVGVGAIHYSHFGLASIEERRDWRWLHYCKKN
jgi:hypothetical protein